MHSTAAEIIKHLKLEKHPEGGYFRRTYCSKLTMVNDQKNKRNIATSIYYLLCNGDFSAWHKIQSDEMWYYNTGDSPVDIYILMPNGTLRTMTIEDMKENPKGNAQALVPAKHWFSAQLRKRDGFALMSCMVAPGFDYDDFTLMSHENLADLKKTHEPHTTLLEELAPSTLRAKL